MRTNSSSGFDEFPARPNPWLLVALAVLLGVLGLRIFSGRRGAGEPAHAEPRDIAPRTELGDDEKATIALFRDASPSVVHITTLVRRTDAFSLNVMSIPQGTGSGFLWDDQGNVVTNFHVIAEADAARVTLADRSSWDARLVGAAPDKDLAVLKIDAPKNVLRAIPVGTSADLGVGQNVFAIGNPFGLDQSLTKGIISALGREFDSPTGRKIKDAIQTDAAINPGNSGGPLLDSAGRLIGVNAAIYSPSGAYAGIGFAIPVDTVNWVVPELIANGRIIRPGLGVQVAYDALNRELRLPGVLIVEVTPDGPAARAGLNPTTRTPEGEVVMGDVIVAIDNQPIKTLNDLLNTLEQHKAGETVTVTVMREGAKRDVRVTLEEIR